MLTVKSFLAVPDKNSSFDADTYKIAYVERKNYFSVRLHYYGELVGNPNFSYEGGKVELFDYCDVDTFELGSIDAWASRAGLRYGEFAACVYKYPEIEELNGLFPLKSDMEDEYGNIKLSDWSNEILKAKANEKSRLNVESGSVGVVEFNLEDGDTM
ncbi:hypothetical protein LIER_18002 [Lithospermum erythrorhizon]|uniref:PB1-like domain-containing protein n=1 Tax=Lithospermum erythrorhizon TaxID=34254 RepID=A0AAV3QE51_LITER